MKTFIFAAKNSNITVTISADNEEEAFAEITQYFNDFGTTDLRLLEEEGEFNN